MTSGRDVEGTIKQCYSTWGTSYYDEYYGADAPYPPVHLELARRLVDECEATRLLDAGCGPASMLRHMLAPGRDIYGFDLTPEMVAEARRVLGAQGLPSERIWEGSVASLDDYAERNAGRDYDCVLCSGVMPHIPQELDATVIANIFQSLRAGGTAIVEARNELFAMFTMNRYSHELFLDRLLPAEWLKQNAGPEKAGLDAALTQVASMFRTDLPPVRKGKVDEPGYDEVLSRAHNPLVLQQQFIAQGFRNAQIYYYHFHALPPMVAGHAPKLFRAASLAMESDPQDWRGLFMASAFFVMAQR
jgi:SAM-dependent methyltransferase